MKRCHKPGVQRSAVTPLCCSSHARRSSLLALLSSHRPPGFTLFELLASIGILAILSALLFAAFNQATKAWLQSESRVETFQQARAALDFMTRELSQAIVTTNIPLLAYQGNLAFIAPVSERTSDGVDLVEVVYRLNWRSINYGSGDPTFVFTNTAPPMKLVRRASPFSATNGDCWNYGQNLPCIFPRIPWDFYNFVTTWPESSASNRTAVLAENVIALQFQFQDIQGNPVPPLPLFSYWNSTDNSSGPPWQNEIGGGVPYFPANALYMTNRAPALVTITIAVVDSRAAARLSTVAYPSTAWNNIVRESRRYFTTSVSIPNRQP